MRLILSLNIGESAALRTDPIPEFIPEPRKKINLLNQKSVLLLLKSEPAVINYYYYYSKVQI